jgi:hypothetical protein
LANIVAVNVLTKTPWRRRVAQPIRALDVSRRPSQGTRIHELSVMRIGDVSGPRVTLRAQVPLAEPLAGFSPGSPDQLLDAERHPLHLGGQHRRIHQIGEFESSTAEFPRHH